MTSQIDQKIQRFLEGVPEKSGTVVKRLTQFVSTGASIPEGNTHLAFYVLETITLPDEADDEPG